METKEIKINIPEGYEIDKENSTFECIKFKKKDKINTWRDIKRIDGCFINNFSEINKLTETITRDDCDKNVFISEKYTKAALALAQISQLMPYYGGEVTDKEWENNEWKYVVSIYGKKDIELIDTAHYKSLIVFHTAQQRDKFLSFPENVQLVKDLYMVD